MNGDERQQALRGLVVDALRGRGEPLFLSDRRAVPAAALYAQVQLERRRCAETDGAGAVDPSSDGCPIDALARLLARLWEGGATVAEPGCTAPLGTGVRTGGGTATCAALEFDLDRFVAACESRRRAPRLERLDATSLAGLDVADALAQILFGARAVHGSAPLEGARLGGVGAPTAIEPPRPSIGPSADARGADARGAVLGYTRSPAPDPR